MKIRVPKEHRPPSRGVFEAKRGFIAKGGKFRPTGAYRFPKKGEFYWSPIVGFVFLAEWHLRITEGPRVILERVEDPK